MSVLNTDEAFVLDVLLEATQPTQSPNALIRSLAEQLIETRKELTFTQKELAAFQLRAADKEMEDLRLKLSSVTPVDMGISPSEQDPDSNDSYW